MALKDYLFTSESVSEGHPDKVCDQISDAILDAFIANDIKHGIADDSHLPGLRRLAAAGRPEQRQEGDQQDGRQRKNPGQQPDLGDDAGEDEGGAGENSMNRHQLLSFR